MRLGAQFKIQNSKFLININPPMRDVSETKRYYLSHEASHIGGFFVYLHKFLKSNE